MRTGPEVLLEAEPYAIAFRIVRKQAANDVQVISFHLAILIAICGAAARSWLPTERVTKIGWVVPTIRIKINSCPESGWIFANEPANVLVVVSGAVIRKNASIVEFGLRGIPGAGGRFCAGKALHEVDSKPSPVANQRVRHSEFANSF